MIYELVKEDSPWLKTNAIVFDFDNFPTDPKDLADNLIETMCHYNGIGLAANQCGLPYHALAIGNPKEPENCSVMFNTHISYYSDEKQIGLEGCLTFPNYFVKIQRSKLIRVRTTNYLNEVVSRTYDGLTARIIQHELDHLNGLTFKDRAKKIHLEEAKRKYKLRMRKMK